MRSPAIRSAKEMSGKGDARKGMAAKGMGGQKGDEYIYGWARKGMSTFTDV